MINALLNGILTFMISLINLILSPIDLLISNLLPDVSNLLSYINDLIDYIISIIGYVIDLSMINQNVLVLIVNYYTFVFTAFITVSSIKLALSWYKALKP